MNTINLKKTFEMANKNTIRKVDIAKATGVSRQMVDHWFNGTARPTPEQNKIIINLFKSKGHDPIF